MRGETRREETRGRAVRHEGWTTIWNLETSRDRVCGVLRVCLIFNDVMHNFTMSLF